MTDHVTGGEPRVIELGYLGFEVSDVPGWERFARDVLGLMVAGRDDDGTVGFRLDDRARRVFVREGPADDLAVLGWRVADADALGAIVDRLRRAGVDVTDGTDAEASARRVDRLCKLRDPDGVPVELFHGQEVAGEPFASTVLASAFVAGELGAGHAVLSSTNTEATLGFYCDLLGLLPTDRITCEIHGYPVDVRFFHANGRHHSLALGGPQRKRIHHFMLEVASMDDVGMCFDRALRAGVRIAQTLGRHPNDRMFSFYAHTPSGFQFEYGWGGREVDDATWQPTTYDRVSEWGHHPPRALAPRRPEPS